MLGKKALNRIFFTTIVFFIVFVLYSLMQTSIQKENNLEANSNKDYVYVLNDDGFISKTSVYVNKTLTLEDKIREKLEIMIEENDKNALLPSYFNPILPINTKIEDVVVENEIVKIYFSKELMNITGEQSEKMIEAIIYTITDETILGIELYVDGEILKYVPHTKKELPTMLTKNFGINKSYDITSFNNIVEFVVTYYGNSNGEYYEIPVTKYVNDTREKLEIVFDELCNVWFGSNLINLIENIEVLNYEISEDTISVNLSRELNSNEEYVFLTSIFNNYDVSKVEILVKNEKKSEKSKKDIEN